MLRVLRWTARISSLIVAIVFGLLWWHQPPAFHALPAAMLIKFGLLSAAVLGLLLGWWRERVGGVVALLGSLGVLVLEGIVTRHFPVIPALLVMIVPAMLYLVVAHSRPPAAAAG
jgi:hypothetical protein